MCEKILAIRPRASSVPAAHETSRLESATWTLARWLKPRDGDPMAPEARPSLSLGSSLARDANGWLVALIPSEWALKTFTDKNDGWTISAQPFPPPAAG